MTNLTGRSCKWVSVYKLYILWAISSSLFGGLFRSAESLELYIKVPQSETCLLELAKLSYVTQPQNEAPPSFCSVRYESPWILWYVCCYPSIFSRWISSFSTTGYLILFLFLKMNLPYSQLSSSVVWAVLGCLLLGYQWLCPIHLSLMSLYRTWERGQLNITKSVYVTCMHLHASLQYYLK